MNSLFWIFFSFIWTSKCVSMTKEATVETAIQAGRPWREDDPREVTSHELHTTDKSSRTTTRRALSLCLSGGAGPTVVPPCTHSSSHTAASSSSLARLATFPSPCPISKPAQAGLRPSLSTRPPLRPDPCRARRAFLPSARALVEEAEEEMAVEKTVPGAAAAAGRTVLVTGGAGYIGSHAVLQLLLAGFRAVVVDNLNNSSELAVRRVAALAGDHSRNLSFHKIDLRDKGALEKVFDSTRFDAVVHFAGLKAVGESVQKPLLYYDNNVNGTVNLLEVMSAYGCKKLVFSSSAAVYGSPKNSPCTEEFPLTPNNPYGKTKLVVEDICCDIYRTDPEWKIVLLRYFNPVGAHPSGYLGEDPCGIPNNLMPYVQQVAVGRRPALTILGNDYATIDGTGVRDYIHVVDLADGHIAALQKLFENSSIGCEAYNLGTGKGTSVLEIVHAFEKASGKKIPLILGPRRPGDAEILFSSTAKAERDLNWKAKYGIEEMCRDQWNWASKNPDGYGSPDSTKQNGHHGYGSAESMKHKGHHVNGSAGPARQNGHHGHRSVDSSRQNGNGHLH